MASDNQTDLKSKLSVAVISSSDILKPSSKPSADFYENERTTNQICESVGPNSRKAQYISALAGKFFYVQNFR